MANDPLPPDPQHTEQQELSYPTLGSYRLLSLLGEGGMGRVYLAKHQVSGLVFAVKVLRPEFASNRSAVRRFIAEARTVSRIGHPNIVRVVDVMEPSAGGQLYYAMEYLTGIDLKRELQSGSMPLLRAVGIGLQICDALQAVHDAGVIHRDLKPANIFLITDGESSDLVKVLDFGLAKLETPDGGTNTTSGHLLGTPAYMSPEQAAGERLDRRSDIYSLGVILYEMFTARRPFEAASFGAYVVQHLTTKPIRPSDLSPPGAPIPDEVDAILLRCLEKHPARRYASAVALGDDLRRLLPRRTLNMVVPRLSRQRSSRWSLIGLPVVGGLVAIAIYALMGSAPQPRDEPRAAATPSEATGRSAAPTSTPAVERAPASQRSIAAPTPSARAVTVRSVPAGASVFVDGAPSPAGVTPCTLAVDGARAHLLVLKRPGFPARQHRVAIGAPDLVEVQLATGPRARGKGVRKAEGKGGEPLDHLTMDPF